MIGIEKGFGIIEEEEEEDAYLEAEGKRRPALRIPLDHFILKWHYVFVVEKKLWASQC
jgi:hypothetical protein